MLELRRLRLLRELHHRGTIAAVADALRFTPSAVSQQLALLEREAGVPLLERAGRGVRLTDAALVLVDHAEALLDRAAEAEADLAAAAGTVAGRVRIAGFQSVQHHLAIPTLEHLRATAPRLRCEVVEAEPEQALPLLPVGDVDVVLGDEWQHQPRRLPPGVEREDLLQDPVWLVLPAGHPAAGAAGGASGAAGARGNREAPATPVRLADLRDTPWATGHAGMGWDEVTQRTCRGLGGFVPDVRHRANDATVSLALVARGLAVALLPGLVLRDPPPGVVVRPIAEAELSRTVFVATRATDRARPSIRATLAAVRDAAARLAS